MSELHNIHDLGNQQIWIYYGVIKKKLTDIKTDIMEDIVSIFWQNHEISNEIDKDAEQFNIHCTKYRWAIQSEKKELFTSLLQQEHDLQKEIKRRQWEMLKEIGIIAPSIRVGMITESTKWEYFPLFDRMIQYSKQIKQGKTGGTRAKSIYYPPGVQEMFKNIGTTPIDVLIHNMWILQN